MRLDNTARLERLLERHPTAVLAEHEPGRSCLYRRDEVLVSAQDVAHVDERIRRWMDRREDFADLSVTRLRLRSAARVDLADLMYALSGEQPYRKLEVTPNHLLRGEPNYSGGPFDTPMPMAVIPAPPRPNGTGRQVTVAVMDTGIDPHPWFDQTSWFADCGDSVREVLDRDEDYDLDSEAGHGTFIAGVILQQAPTARITVERVLGSDGVCDELDLIRGLDSLRRRSAATGRPIDIVNLSLGGYSFDDRPSPLLTQAIARLGRRVAIVAAAGNNGSDRPFWPAALKNCIAVGSLNAAAQDRSSFSNYGWWVDACAVGEGVRSSFVTFTERSGQRDDREYSGFAAWSGTSFATPKVAGAIAALATAKEDMSIPDAADAVLDQDINRTVPDLGVIVPDEAIGPPAMSRS